MNSNRSIQYSRGCYTIFATLMYILPDGRWLVQPRWLLNRSTFEETFGNFSTQPIHRHDITAYWKNERGWISVPSRPA